MRSVLTINNAQALESLCPAHPAAAPVGAARPVGGTAVNRRCSGSRKCPLSLSALPNCWNGVTAPHCAVSRTTPA
jgi:hypothetical protein